MFQALISRHFEYGFHRFNRHRPTWGIHLLILEDERDRASVGFRVQEQLPAVGCGDVQVHANKEGLADDASNVVQRTLNPVC